MLGPQIAAVAGHVAPSVIALAAAVLAAHNVELDADHLGRMATVVSGNEVGNAAVSVLQVIAIGIRKDDRQLPIASAPHFRAPKKVRCPLSFAARGP